MCNPIQFYSPNVRCLAMFGKDQYHTSFAENITGPSGSTATVSWEFDAGSGNTTGQPVVSADGDVYFGSANSSGKLTKLNKNGEKQWEYATNVSIGMPAILSDGVVYFGRIGAGGGLAFTALNSDGSKKWDFDDASIVKTFTVSEKGEAYFTFQSGSQDKLVVLKTDGSLKTTISGSGLSGFAPVVLENGNIITTRWVSGNQFFTSYSADGTQLWDLAYTGANGNYPLDPSYDKTTGKTYSAAGHELFDIPSDGSIINVHNIAPWNYDAATTVAIDSDALYVGFNNENSASGSLIYTLNKADLSTRWSFQTGSRLNKQIVVDKKGNVYFSTQSGELYSLKKNGSQNWKIEAGMESTISPTLTDGAVVWGYGNRLTSIGVK